MGVNKLKDGREKIEERKRCEIRDKEIVLVLKQSKYRCGWFEVWWVLLFRYGLPSIENLPLFDSLQTYDKTIEPIKPTITKFRYKI